ncbi:glycosyltransferase [Photobacterium sanguinicancri]|uniref:glycosyltransferase n=1 Tax=Photobacterium sanguinicancri TaxID=875932 RepID=UPI0024806CCB|nr:glycosyltransferase [Photobacterium sanguinicancri]
MMKAIILCDHSLDPRLRKRTKWLGESGYDVSIYTDSNRGKHFSNNEFFENDLSGLTVNDLKDIDLVYISGAKVILQKFILIFNLSKENINVVYEIPDLPLRSHFNFINKIILFLFSLVVQVLFSNVVVTSGAFIRFLPKNKNYFLCENLPPDNLINNQVGDSLAIDNKLKVGFVGALRYPHQMLLLIKYCVDNDYIALFFGGPKENEIKLRSLCNENSLIIESNVEFHGAYDQNELSEIYGKIDFVYSVYDAKQPNVRLALPNKLYEAQLFKTPIIVAKNTYLSECVSELEVGFSVDSTDYNKFSDDMNEGLKMSFLIDPSLVEGKIKSSKSDFSQWIEKL